ncbi:GDSL esterase/lipase At1g71691-like [Phragmites australis]|uniref:GDSL esterase/lipase At1g71691-like n=1 Tax=Phragmites australis TaxID=29695 RepID=UPI002D7957A4|nr:GDSL esterase/lipase At1g71691-like [Phragmites australis]
MAGGLRQWRLLLGVMLALTAPVVAAEGGGARAPALFVFGDSLIDSGNNNNLASLAKANYFPYGIDFADGPTGRFCNGYTIVDELAQLLGLPLVPPYSQVSSVQQILQGVNYASAAAGILDDSGQNFVGRIPFNQQISNFESTVAQIAGAVGAAAAAGRLGRSILFVGMGSNDYLNNYLMPNYDTRRRYNPQQFADLLVRQYASQLTRLYNAGARKFVVAGVGSMGCIPSVLAQSLMGRCSQEVNDLVLPFNANVRAMLDGLNADLPGARFTYLDNFRVFRAILGDPASFGFSVVDEGCCGIGRNGGQVTCLPFMPPCADRERYVFWDAYHPTAAVNVIIANQAFHGGADVVAPINVRQLANL